MRTIAIGDIHGCSKALQGILDAIAPTSEDRLIFLGDYVDRGPDSKWVIQRLLELSEFCDTIFLLGNHEIMFRGVLRGLDPTLWLQQGGSQTVTSYGGILDRVPETHRYFLERCQPYFETPQHMFLHANYIADLPLASQPEEALFWEHLTDRLPAPHASGKHVFCGHTPQRDGNIAYLNHLTCLDTYCFGGLWLSAVDIESGETWQVSREGHVRQNWYVAKQLWGKCQSFSKLFKAPKRYPRDDKSPNGGTGDG